MIGGKFSVNIKMNEFVGDILQSKFYACCYILLSGTRPKRRCIPILSVFIPILTYYHESSIMTEEVLFYIQTTEMGF